MYQAFIISESLADPTVLNAFNQLYVRVEHHPETDEVPFWHLFKIEIADAAIDRAANQICAALKPGWYVHAWNDTEVRICLPELTLTLTRAQMNGSAALERVKQAAREAGIEEQYLDFWIED